MATLSEIFSHLHTIASVFFALLFLELVILVRSVTGGACTHASTRRRMTPAQFQEIVEQKFPAGRFEAGGRGRSADCAVCLSEFKEGERVRVLPCGHVFHRECLDRWLERGWTTCPLCRNRVFPESVAAGMRRGEVEYDGSDEEFMFLLSALHGNSLHRYL